MRLLRRMVCFYLVSHLQNQAPSVKNQDLHLSSHLSILKLPTTSLLLSSLSFYFFQYVKELAPRSSPSGIAFVNIHPLLGLWWALVENNGFEPLTPCVQGRCSSQLS